MEKLPGTRVITISFVELLQAFALGSSGVMTAVFHDGKDGNVYRPEGSSFTVYEYPSLTSTNQNSGVARIMGSVGRPNPDDEDAPGAVPGGESKQCGLAVRERLFILDGMYSSRLICLELSNNVLSQEL